MRLGNLWCNRSAKILTLLKSPKTPVKRLCLKAVTNFRRQLKYGWDQATPCCQMGLGSFSVALCARNNLFCSIVPQDAVSQCQKADIRSVYYCKFSIDPSQFHKLCRRFWMYFLQVFCIETFHAVGVGVFVFRILPDLDAVTGNPIINCNLLTVFSKLSTF